MGSTTTEALYLTKMPELLRISFIGKTLEHILRHDMDGAGFITTESIEELFKNYTNISFEDACQTINTTPKDFIDQHFSELFKNCYPHGLAPLHVVDKPVKKFSGFEITETAS